MIVQTLWLLALKVWSPLSRSNMGHMGILLQYTQSHILSTEGGLYPKASGHGKNRAHGLGVAECHGSTRTLCQGKS